MAVYEFPTKCGSSVFQFNICLPRIRVWRRVLVPCDYNFKDLHFVIQNLFGWSSTHMYKFNVVDRRNNENVEVGGCGGEIYKWMPESTKLHNYFKKQSDQATYYYDFGSLWLFNIKLEDIIPTDPSIKYPKCIDGRRGAPPEHRGGDSDEEERYDPDFFDPKLITFDKALDFFDEDHDFRGGITPQNYFDDDDSSDKPEQAISTTIELIKLIKQAKDKQQKVTPKNYCDSSDYSDDDESSNVPEQATSTTKLVEQARDKQQKVDNLPTQNSNGLASSVLTLKNRVPKDEEPKSMSSKPCALESKDLPENNNLLEKIRAFSNSDSDPSNNSDFSVVTEDAEESFGKLIASQMREIKNLERRDELRIQIQRLISEYRFKK